VRGQAPESVPTPWQLWEVGPPALAREIVSRDVGKDYEDVPAEYAAMGAKELVLFDPARSERAVTRGCDWGSGSTARSYS
jgi:hypothetical protein